ncbi:MAG: M28 family peptidase [Planctomycetota bacterium]
MNEIHAGPPARLTRRGARGLIAAILLVCTASTCGDGGARRPAPNPIPELPPLPKQTDTPTDLGDRALAHVRAIVAIGPRTPGSPGLQRVRDYVAGQFEALGLPARRDAFRNEKEKLDFQNLVVRIPGPTRDYVLLGAHIDSKITKDHPDPSENFEFVGANDGASGVGLLIALAEKWVKSPPPCTIELAFFDGEESIPFRWDPDRSLFGSRHHAEAYGRAVLADPKLPRMSAMILLDMIGSADLQLDDDTWSDPGLKSIVRAAAKTCGHAELCFGYSQAVTDDHLPFRDQGVPVLDLIDLHDNPQWHTKDDTVAHLSAKSLQSVGEILWTALPTIATRFAGADPRRPR